MLVDVWVVMEPNGDGILVDRVVDDGVFRKSVLEHGTEDGCETGGWVRGNGVTKRIEHVRVWWKGGGEGGSQPGLWGVIGEREDVGRIGWHGEGWLVGERWGCCGIRGLRNVKTEGWWGTSFFFQRQLDVWSLLKWSRWQGAQLFMCPSMILYCDTLWVFAWQSYVQYMGWDDRI